MDLASRVFLPVTLCLLLNLCLSVLAFPILTESNTESNNNLESAILSVLKSRTRREAPPVADVKEPETAAHYAALMSRSYGVLAPVPKLLIPSYYYRPRVFVSVPQDYYSRYPKSDLFRMRSGSYINDLLPIFKKETPTAKVDPVPASQLPVEPSGGSNSVDNFPFWNQQSSNWVWPDGISTGSLPSALFGLQNKAVNSVDMASLPAVDVELGPADTGTRPVV